MEEVKIDIKSPPRKPNTEPASANVRSPTMAPKAAAEVSELDPLNMTQKINAVQSDSELLKQVQTLLKEQGENTKLLQNLQQFVSKSQIKTNMEVLEMRLEMRQQLNNKKS